MYIIELTLRTNFEKIYCENIQESLSYKLVDEIKSCNTIYKDFAISFYLFLNSKDYKLLINISSINEDFNPNDILTNYNLQKELCDKINDTLIIMNEKLKDKFSLPNILFMYRGEEIWIKINNYTALEAVSFFNPQIIETVNPDFIDWEDYID